MAGTELAIFPDFQRSLNEVPIDDWTVEELSRWCLLKSSQTIEQVTEIQKRELQAQCDIPTIEKQIKTMYDQSKSTAAAAASQAVGAAETCPTVVIVKIITGPYKGKKYELHPRPKKPCFVGRSRGKITANGICLAKDQEVSTTHGKFEIVGRNLCFTDTDSTNGSYLVENDELVKLEPEFQYTINPGALLTVGQSKLQLTLQ